MTRRRASILAGIAVVAAAGLGAGVAIAATSGGGPAPNSTVATSPGGPGYSYYRSMMGGYFGGSSMMGGTGSYQWMMGPAGGPDETFRIAGMVNPAVVVPAGAMVSIQVINADPDTAHGLVVTASSGQTSWMPMMTSRPAFTGSALWFLGNPTTAGMHAGTLTFTAATPGTYHYLCPVPGHAQKGMTGTFTVSPS